MLIESKIRTLRSRTGHKSKAHLQHGTPALINTSGDITVVFSPRIAKVTDQRQMKMSLVE
jgi:hypothetical protein